MIKKELKIEDIIINKIDEMFGYKVLEIEISVLDDEEGKFSIYTILLDLEDRNYSKLLDEEWVLSQELNLYDNKIIVRFL